MARSPHEDEPTKEFPIYMGSAPVSAPTTAIPYYEQEPPPRRPRRRLGVMLLSLFAVGLIVLAVGVIAGYGLSQTGKPAGNSPAEQALPVNKPSPTPPKADTPSQVTDRFLAAALNGQEATMQEQLCGLLKSEGKKDGTGGTGLGIFVGYKIGKENINNLGATVSVELTVPLLGPIKFDVYLLKESGGWRVCGAGPS
ncbi:hypothetical protein Rhe02_38340 [Rhizocola hellebori]|uniref:DUF4878 domain-containing protein n=1 Tax=Rhizocola hellebori TaxID=1392758 RepID=A0A8J3Q9P4_9ACTN|nr:hypothetical protein [Rhizocola hellebori]GIH05767.1 hypothetical protein Rhe02_38340 [Rhizocola hellebori]